MTTTAPPANVIAAFGGDADALVSLAGGEGHAWRAGSIVLKPAREPEVVAWLAATVEEIEDTDGFRMARHIPARGGGWVADGWEATGWLDGAHVSEQWDDILSVSDEFHAAIASVAVPDGGIPRPGPTPWTVGDAVAWREREYDAPPSVSEVLERLRPVLSTQWTGAAPQVIHGDMGGNVLFADGLPAAVIDVSPYVRPAGFASAIAVVDALAWEAAPLTLAIRFGTRNEFGEQLLARAVVFRLVAACEAWRDLPERVAAEVDAYRPVLSAIRTFG